MQHLLYVHQYFSLNWEFSTVAIKRWKNGRKTWCHSFRGRRIGNLFYLSINSLIKCGLHITKLSMVILMVGQGKLFNASSSNEEPDYNFNFVNNESYSTISRSKLFFFFKKKRCSMFQLFSPVRLVSFSEPFFFLKICFSFIFITEILILNADFKIKLN